VVRKIEDILKSFVEYYPDIAKDVNKPDPGNDPEIGDMASQSIIELIDEDGELQRYDPMLLDCLLYENTSNGNVIVTTKSYTGNIATTLTKLTQTIG